jgi:acetyl esterase/lipase
MMLGEVDDGAAAVRWLASQEYVDSKKIYVFGHSSGGVMSAILSLYDNLPVRHTGSAGGLYGPDLFDAMARMAPFEQQDPRERQMRVLIGNIRWMKRPHFAFIGSGDDYMRGEAAEQEASRAGAPLTATTISGNHHSSLAPAMRNYLEIIRQEK